MDSYGDGNTYRGMVCKDSEIKTIEINRYNADVERLECALKEIKEELEHDISNGNVALEIAKQALEVTRE